MFAVKPSLLCLLTAHNTAGSGKIGVAKVEEHREVSRCWRGQADWWCGDVGTQGGERIDHEVRSQALHCQTCSSHVNPHATHMGAWA